MIADRCGAYHGDWFLPCTVQVLKVELRSSTLQQVPYRWSDHTLPYAGLYMYNGSLGDGSVGESTCHQG